MKFHKNKLLTIGAAVALTLAVAACSSNDDDDQTSSMMPTTTPTDPETPTPLNELETAQADAAAAAADAMTASSDAADAAKAAMEAGASLATIQTRAAAAALAEEAATYAGKAMAAYMDAKAASKAAAEAEDVTAAVEARIMAETAMGNAVKYATMASEKGTAAETAAMAELMIIDKDKNVGDSSLNADDGSTTVTVDGQSTITGRMTSMDPMTTGMGVADGTPGVADNDQTADTDETVAHVQQVADRTFPIGRTLDTSDDMARLILVHSYAGSEMVNVYNRGGDTESGTKAGYLSLDDNDADTEDDVNNVALKSAGTYYPAGPESAGSGSLDSDDEVADDAEAKEVFSYVDPADDMTKYAVLTTESTTEGTTTYTYTAVDVDVDITNGDPTKVKARLPEATEYKHIHFGVWAALGEAAKDGLQEIADRGIGFVQNFSGEGMTSIGGGSDDMPNNGEATYMGNWVAAVQREDADGNGPIALDDGAAMLTADFEDGEITALLTGLATLSGDISGNEFLGTEASLITHEDLDGTGEFTGSFSGGFYGAKAAEAGGIFDFMSEDSEAGAFRGAFGGDRQ